METEPRWFLDRDRYEPFLGYDKDDNTQVGFWYIDRDENIHGPFESKDAALKDRDGSH